MQTKTLLLADEWKNLLGLICQRECVVLLLTSNADYYGRLHGIVQCSRRAVLLWQGGMAV